MVQPRGKAPLSVMRVRPARLVVVAGFQCSSQSLQRPSTSVMRLSNSMPSRRGTVLASTPLSVARSSSGSRLPASIKASGMTL